MSRSAWRQVCSVVARPGTAAADAPVMPEIARNGMLDPLTPLDCAQALYPIENPYTPWAFVAGVAALVLIIEGVAYMRRGAPRARPQLWLTVSVWGLVAWALVLTGWSLQVASTFVSGPCADPVSSAPVPPDAALTVLTLASSATALAAAILPLVVAVGLQRPSRARVNG